MQKKKILFIPFEFLTWERAGTWPYSVHLGLEEGLAANDIEFFTLPSLYEIPSSMPANWLNHAQRLTEGMKFDQIWFFLRHTQIDDSFFEWAAGIAPVRVGFIMESLQVLPEEMRESPHLAEVVPFVENQVAYMTHVLAYDEQDALDIEAAGGRNALWCPWSIPLKYLDMPLPSEKKPQAAFTGAFYGRRMKFFEYAPLQEILVRPDRSEFSTELPQIFNELSMLYYGRLHNGEELGRAELGEYLDIIRRIRKDVFVKYMLDMSQWSANVVLPAGFKGYSNRVVESASARVPLISWDIPGRPLNRRLFRPDEEILLYDQDEPAQLEAQIRRVIENPDFARTLVRNLRIKVMHYHTTELRVRQILDWVESGIRPDYGLDA